MKPIEPDHSMLDSQDQTERGSALVLVVLLMLAVTVLVITTLSGLNSSLKSQRHTVESQTLQFVLQSGIADAMNELKLKTDVDGDGLGAVGIAVPKDVRASDGRLLGRYRATIDSSDPAQLVLEVVAAFPAFGHPRARYMSARTVVSEAGATGLFDRNALTLNIPEEGVKDPKKKLFKIDDESLVSITDPSDLVPAVNVTNSDFLAAFLAAFDDSKPNVTVEGLGGAGADTVVNQPGTLLTQENLFALAKAVSDYVDGVTYDNVVDPGKGNHIKPGVDPALITGLSGVVRFDENAGDGKGKKLKIEEVTVSGSGTLIISRELELKKGGTINWDGDVIIYSDDKKKAKLKMHGGELNVTGNVILVANPEKKSKVDLHFHGKKNYANQIDVKGSFLALSAGEGDKGDVKLKFHEGGKKVSDEPHLKVDGLFAVLGTKIDFELKGKKHKDDKEDDDDADDEDDGENTEIDGTTLEVNGSTVFAVAVNLDAKKKSDALKKFKLKKDANLLLTFDNDLYESALSGLDAFFNGLPSPPELDWGNSGYVEVPGKAAYLKQQAAIDASDPISVP